MLKKKGFTLIEMLAVVTILGIISALAFPYTNNLLKKSKDNEYNRFLDDIYLATEAYLVDNSDNYNSITQNGGNEYISLEKIVKNGYLKSTTINPKTGKKINLDSSVKVTNNNKKYNYELMDKNYDINAYISEGLVLMYDISSKPIVSSSNFIWKDLSGNNNDVTLENFSSDINSWYDYNGILFNGTNNYGKIGIHNYDYITVTAVVEPLNIDSSNFSDIIANIENGGYGLYYTSSRGFYFGVYYNNTFNRNISNVGENNIYYSMTGVFDGSNNKLFVNESNFIIEEGNDFKITSSKSDTILMLGANPSGESAKGEFAKMKLKNIRLYNRALTDDEIKQNYEIDKERFGL